MLQIISGKFFEGDDRHTSQRKGILYSNFGWIGPIVTCVGTLEPVEYFGAAPGYVFSYTNQMEKRGDPKAGELISTGEREIVSQFALLAGFALSAYFDIERGNVLLNCRSRATSTNERYVPSHFVDDVFSAERRGTVADREELIRFIDKAIGLPRESYKALVDVLDALYRAYQAINGSLDLAYSMVVYCLESLAQRFDKYEPTWADYDEGPRNKLDEALGTADPSVAQQVRGVLLGGAHLKLRARFLHFVKANLGPDFFTKRTNGKKRPVLASEFDRALSNAYNLRSGYVHQLRSIQEHLHIAAIADGEVFVWEREPYLTMRGLANIARAVICSFVERTPSVKSEKVDWRADLPGVIRLYPAPQYWIWQHEHIEKLKKRERLIDVTRRYSGLLEQLLGIATGENDGIVNLQQVCIVYERLIDQCGEEERRRVVATYVLYNLLSPPEIRAPKWEQLRATFEDDLDVRTIESVCMEVMLDVELRGDLNDCIKAYETFVASRFKKTMLEVPHLLEVKVLAAIANKALGEGNTGEHKRLLQLATGEAAGHSSIQAALTHAASDGRAVNLKGIFSLDKARRAKAPEATSACPDAQATGAAADPVASNGDRDASSPETTSAGVTTPDE